MFVESSDDEQIIERVAALDIGKAEVVCCVRLPGRRTASVGCRRCPPTRRWCRRCVSWRTGWSGSASTRVVMEATSDYWRPPFYLFEAHGLEPWLVNAKDVKHLPGRPKTDRLDAVWLCKVAERQMLRPSFVPPGRDPPAAGPDPLPGRPGRGPHRGEEPGREAAGGRLHQAVGRRLRHLRRLRPGDDDRPDRRGTRPQGAGRDGPVPDADQDPARWRRRSPGCRWAPSTTTTGSCWPGCWPAIDAVNADIAAVDTQIGDHLAPFADAVARLDEIPGIGPTAAAVIIAEIGVDMTRFPTPAHLASWAKFAPGINSSAGKTKGNGSTGHGNRYLARVLGEAAVVRRPDRHLPRRPLPTHRPPPRQEEGHRRGRPLHPGDHLAPARRPRHPTSTTSAPTTTTATSTPTPNDATTSANSKPSATTSPSNPPPDRPSHSRGSCLVTSIFGLANVPLSGRPFRAENGVVAVR